MPVFRTVTDEVSALSSFIWLSTKRAFWFETALAQLVYTGTKAGWLHLHRRLTCGFTDLDCGADKDPHSRPGRSTILWFSVATPIRLQKKVVVSSHLLPLDRSKGSHSAADGCTAVAPAPPAERCGQRPPRLKGVRVSLRIRPFPFPPPSPPPPPQPTDVCCCASATTCWRCAGACCVGWVPVRGLR